MSFAFDRSLLATAFRGGALALFLLPGIAWAADVTAAAGLSETNTTVGDPVRYTIKITGARQTQSTPRIAVDGLEIEYAGQSTQLQLDNFNLTASVVHTYTVVPKRAGTFVIPPQRVEAAGRFLTTNAVTLTAQASGAVGGTNQPAVELGFAELVVPKSTLYVGESVSLELRVLVDARVRWNLREPPSMKGDGWTIQPFKEPQQEQLTRNGRVYDAVTFKTVATPVKDGHLELGPGELNCVVQIPRVQKARPHFGIDDIFDDDIFTDPFGTFSRNKLMSFRAEPVQIQIKPLPTANQPKTFSGAVGQFTLGVEAAPTKVHVGDPITLTLKVAGRGNFDRVSAPQMVEPEGWRSYPPSSKWKADDPLGLSGTKTFEMAVIPDDRKARLPKIEFSYFDPATEKYVTLNGKEMPVVVEGEPARPPERTAAASTPPDKKASATPAKEQDILHIQTEFGPARSFAPLYRSTRFWAVQSVPLAAFLAFCGFQLWKGRNSHSSAQQTAAARRQKNDLLKTLRQDNMNAPDFLAAATRLLQLEAAATSGQPASLLEAAEVCASRELDSETAQRIETLFRARDELRYTGTGSNGEAVAPELRAEALETIRLFENSHVRP